MVLVTVNVGEFSVVTNTFNRLILRSRFHYLQISEKVIIYNSYEEKLRRIYPTKKKGNPELGLYLHKQKDITHWLDIYASIYC